MSKNNEVAEVTENTITKLAPDSIIQVIQQAATDPNVDIDKMERLMQMHERLVAKQDETAFNNAMADAQTDIRRVAADSRNEQTHSDYASYAALDRAIRPVYSEHGFSLSFDTGETPIESHVRVICNVSHRGGHTRQYHVDMPADGKGAKGGDVMTKTHAVGSGLQYGMRYLLKLIFNVAIGYDDDGNAAGEATITEEQAADLEALMTEVGAGRKAFLKTCKVDDLAFLPASKLKGAIQRLEQKRRQA